MPTVTVSLDGGGQLTVQTSDPSPLVELDRALRRREPGEEFRIRYRDAEIIVPDGAKVFGGSVSD